MKQHLTIFILILFVFIGCNQKSQKLPFDNSMRKEQTLIKGRVNNWHTDTVYMATLPYHSPYSTIDDYMVLNSDKSFEFIFNDFDKPFILCLTPERKFLDHRSFLLYECFTEEYYTGYCKNFFTMPMSTYIIEPNTETIVELNKDGRYGETEIKFLNENAYNTEFYQTTFDIDQRFDEILTHSTTVDSEIVNKIVIKYEKKIENELLDLEHSKPFISPFLYSYVKAEIIFGAKKEFLRDIMLDHQESELFRSSIPKNVTKMIDFDKEIDYATLISQEYNEFIELYLNFKNSQNKRELILHMPFDSDKFDLASNELPQLSKYYYLANNLLHSEVSKETLFLYKRFVAEYPNGELNNRLLDLYN